MFLLAITDLKGKGKIQYLIFSVGQKTVYSFIIQDSPARLFTMRQFDEDYLSGYRLYSSMMGDFFLSPVEYLMRKAIILQYYLMGFVKYDVDGTEETDELNWFPWRRDCVKDYPMTDKFLSSVNIHLWDQPADLGFNDSKSKFWRRCRMGREIFPSDPSKKQLKGISVDLGLIYKTAGFLPEEVKLQKHFGIRMGTSFALDE